MLKLLCILIEIEKFVFGGINYRLNRKISKFERIIALNLIFKKGVDRQMLSVVR